MSRRGRARRAREASWVERARGFALGKGPQRVGRFGQGLAAGGGEGRRGRGAGEGPGVRRGSGWRVLTSLCACALGLWARGVGGGFPGLGPQPSSRSAPPSCSHAYTFLSLSLPLEAGPAIRSRAAKQVLIDFEVLIDFGVRRARALGSEVGLGPRRGILVPSVKGSSTRRPRPRDRGRGVEGPRGATP